VLYIDDRLPRHPKILKAGTMLGANGSALALALYLDGLSYARGQLTDGFIPDEFVASSVLVRCPLDVAKVLVDRRVRLWHRAHGGYRIHDFLQWNKTASEIKEKQEHERVKKARQRAKKKPPSGDVSPGMSPGDIARARANHVPRPRTTNQRSSESGDAHASAAGSDELEARAERFCARYAQLYAVHRHGARYHNAADRDLEEARGLVAAWDDARLDALMTAFLTTDEPFCQNGNGTIAQFRSRASWCDAKLREAGL
jgi:hypothetical protein